MPTYGQRPDDVVQDSRGNSLKGVLVKLYTTEALAIAGDAPLGTATTDSRGRWSFPTDEKDLWARLPDGTVWQVAESVDGVVAAAEAAAASAGTAATDAASSANAATSLANGKVSKGDLVINAADYGTVGDGVADDTAALNDAATAAAAAGANTLLLIPRGTYRTTGTVRITSQVEGTQATINYYGTGTALVVGNDLVAGTVTFRLSLRLPRVVFSNGGNWDGTSIGVKLVNLNTCDVYVPWVQEFETGLICTGESAGFAYNTITLGLLGQNHKNVVLTSNGTGWCNQNSFHGGRLSHGVTAKGATVDDPNAAQLALVRFGVGVAGPNNNTFTGTSMEGANIALYRLQLDGASYNTFVNCRYECMSGATDFKVNYLNGASSNRIIGGYDAWKIVESFDATTTPGGTIYDDASAYTSATLASAQVFTHDVPTTITAWNTPTSRRLTYNAPTGEFTPRRGRWLITAQVTFAPNATGRRRILLSCAGSVQRVVELPGNAIRTTLTVTEVFSFNGAQTFKIDAHQTSGADLALDTSAGYCKVVAQYLPN